MTDNFKGSNKAEWMELIEKSSKGKSYASFSKELHGIQISAFNMASDLKDIGATNRQSSHWKIGVRLAKQEPEALNRSLLQFLQIGAEAISIPIESAAHLPIVYKDIHADWIHNDLILAPGVHADTLHSFFPPNTSLSVSSIHDSSDETSLSIRIDREQSPAHYIAQIISRAERLLEEGFSVQNIMLHIETGVYLPLEVSLVRALRIVWANYMAAKNFKDYSLHIAAHIVTKEEDKDIQLIEQCVAGMNAVMGGADILFLAASGIDANYERLAFQIQNVMKLESKMEQEVDVFAGSFAIENLTNTLATKAWEKVISVLA